MGTVRDLIIKAPYLCGATDPSRFSEIGKFVFDSEKASADSPFKRNSRDVEIPENRMGFAFLFGDGDEGKRRHCIALARIAELTHYKVAHGDNTASAELDRLIVEAVDAEVDYPDVAAVLTVDEASSAVSAAGW